VTFDIFLD
jgi:hypothetical protein